MGTPTRSNEYLWTATVEKPAFRKYMHIARVSLAGFFLPETVVKRSQFQNRIVQNSVLIT